MRSVARLAFAFLAALVIPACGSSNKKGPNVVANPPTTLVATSATTARIDLTWVDDSNNEFEFRIERSDAFGGPYVQVGTSPMNTQGFSDLGLQANKMYFYRVTAWNSRGNSAFAGPSSATTNPLAWVAGPMGGGPGLGRANHSAIYDSSIAGQRMIVFGGIDDAITVLNDTLSYSLASTIPGTPWSPLTTTGTIPPPLLGHSANYDSLNHRMVVFGGQAELPNPTPPPPLALFYQNTVHVLDLTTLVWSQPAVTGTPPSPRAFHTAIYDSANQRIVVFGGFDGSILIPDQLSDVHALSLSTFTWTALPGTGPIKREQHGAIYDPLRERMVVFGGKDNDAALDGSLLNNESWTLAFGGSPSWTQLFFSGTPTFKMGHTACYDAANQRMVIFGGASTTAPNSTNELWGMRLDVTPAWAILNFPAPGAPLPRFGHSAVYDSANNRLIIYGGFDDTSAAFDEVWVISL